MPHAMAPPPPTGGERRENGAFDLFMDMPAAMWPFQIQVATHSLSFNRSFAGRGESRPTSPLPTGSWTAAVAPCPRRRGCCHESRPAAVLADARLRNGDRPRPMPGMLDGRDRNAPASGHRPHHPGRGTWSAPSPARFRQPSCADRSPSPCAALLARPAEAMDDHGLQGFGGRCPRAGNGAAAGVQSVLIRPRAFAGGATLPGLRSITIQNDFR